MQKFLKIDTPASWGHTCYRISAYHNRDLSWILEVICDMLTFKTWFLMRKHLPCTACHCMLNVGTTPFDALQKVAYHFFCRTVECYLIETGQIVTKFQL